MSIARSQSNDRYNSMSDEFSRLFVCSKAQTGQFRKDNFFELERFFIVDWVEPVVGNGLGSLSPHCIRRKAEHVHFNISAAFLFREKLARNDPHTDSPCDDAVHCGLSERVELESVSAAHEIWLAEVATATVVFKYT